MDIQKINQYKTIFDSIVSKIEGDDGSIIEVWYARDLQSVLGYARWENFMVAINRAIDSCKTQSVKVEDHFREVTKMVMLGSESQCSINDFMLTRYAGSSLSYKVNDRKVIMKGIEQSYYYEGYRRVG